MQDKVFDMYESCPNCGKEKGLYYTIQYPIYVDVSLNDIPFIFKQGKRKKLLQRDWAWKSKSTRDFQTAVCNCEYCGWCSEPIVP